MKKFALKSAALAIAALVGSSAFAAPVDLDSATPVAIKYATEQTITTSANLRDGAAADQRATTTFGASFGADVAAYVRIDLTGGAFAGTPSAAALAVNDSAGAATVSVAQIGANNEYVIFAVTPSAGDSLVGANAVTIDTDIGGAGTGLTVTSKAGVSLRYRLFETLTAAVNPATNNTLKDKSATYVSFTSALASAVTPLSATADVAASPSYTAFTGGGAKSVAKVEITVDGTVALASGAAATAGGLLAATSDVVFTGDFTLAANDAGTYTGAALARTFLYSVQACTGGANTVGSATTLTATTATFTDVAAATLVGTHYLCLSPEGTPEIPAASYNVAVDFEPQTGFAVSDLSGVAAGSISRNGVRMIAPLAQTTTGYVSRLVLTNTGSSARSYTISAVSETGTTVALSNAAASGSLPAGKTTVVDLPANIAIAGGAPRTSLVVTVNAPQSEIDGLYQIVNPVGAVSNMLLSYKN